jgi:hypothetical protein
MLWRLPLSPAGWRPQGNYDQPSIGGFTTISVGASLLAMDGAAIRHSKLTSLKNKMSFPDGFFRAPDQ